MPLPLLFVIVPAVAGIYGALKGGEAVGVNKEAGTVSGQARDIYKKAERDLDKARADAKSTLEALGRAKIDAWGNQMSSFVKLFEQLKNVELEGAPVLDELRVKVPNRNELAAMKTTSLEFKDLAVGGSVAAGSGALIGLASYGGALTFASASTGTAISALGGAAATNATLAWFGGGSLAAGGMGMAGGMAILGGIVAGPVLAVGGLVFAAKARENLANARKHHAEAKMAAAEMRTARSIVEGINRVADSAREVTVMLAARMDPVLKRLASAIQAGGTDYRALSVDQKGDVYLAVQFAQLMKLVLETPILTPSGALTDESVRVLDQARRFMIEA